MFYHLNCHALLSRVEAIVVEATHVADGDGRKPHGWMPFLGHRQGGLLLDELLHAAEAVEDEADDADADDDGFDDGDHFRGHGETNQV